MIPAMRPRPHTGEARLLWIDPPSRSWRDASLREIVGLLAAGDLLVLNDAATVPASLRGTDSRGEDIELRLAAAGDAGEWFAVLFGQGDWRQRTEDRPPAPRLEVGDRITFAGALVARITSVSEVSRRLVTVRFDQQDAALWDALYRAGKPVQYSYLEAPLASWDVQTAFAGRPWAVEPPSAGLPLTWDLLARLRLRGVRTAYLTHGAGLSSTGDPAIDALLPLPERYEIPEETVRAIDETRAAGGRVIAVGTSVMRALEGSAVVHGGRVAAEQRVTDLRIGPGFAPRIVDGLLTGVHDPGTSHYELLLSLASRELVDGALAHAEEMGYLGHEFGDLCLILGRSSQIEIASGRSDRRP